MSERIRGLGVFLFSIHISDQRLSGQNTVAESDPRAPPGEVPRARWIGRLAGSS